MSSEPAIRVKNLCKYYHMYQNPEDRLKQYLLPRLQRMTGQREKKYYREFKALDNISFEVNRGEAVGIIGRNGAGKSTLLQLICGTLTQSSGDIMVNGQVAALLELGSGFNPQFTGRENVYLNASLLGLSNKETDEKFDEIAAFADIGEYMDQATKTYSSGMRMRLAFAVNTCVEPDILIVDEALGVGDAPFQSKCFKRLRNLIDNGTTILFVSHDISTVRSICSRALWLKNGRAEMWGEAILVAKEYEKFCWSEQGVVLEVTEGLDQPESVELSSPQIRSAEFSTASVSYENMIVVVPPHIHEPNPVFIKNRELSRMGTGVVQIKNLILLNQANEPQTTFDYNETVNLYYLLDVCEFVDSDFVLALRLRDLKGNFVYSVNDLTRVHRLTGAAGDKYIASTSITLPLHHQDYVISTAIFGFQSGQAWVNGQYDFSRSIIWEAIEDAAFISVRQFRLMPLAGPVHISADLKFAKLQ